MPAAVFFIVRVVDVEVCIGAKDILLLSILLFRQIELFERDLSSIATPASANALTRLFLGKLLVVVIMSQCHKLMAIL